MNIDAMLKKLDECRNAYKPATGLPWLDDLRQILEAGREVKEKDCEHEWSKPATGISYQFCLKKGCYAQKGDIVEPVPPEAKDIRKCLNCGWEMVSDICPNCDAPYGMKAVSSSQISIDRKVAERWVAYKFDCTPADKYMADAIRKALEEK